MSLEIDLGRIANALEQMVKLMQNENGVTKINYSISAPKDANQGAPAIAKEKKSAPKTEAPVVEADPFAEQPVASDAVITLDQLTEVLKQHAKALGTKITIALIIKHGADKTTPKINTIPTANFKACFDEANKDLVKLGGKK